nr:hypothetical protein Iba_chr11bCG1760 [Ipomoea batatas]
MGASHHDLYGFGNYSNLFHAGNVKENSKELSSTPNFIPSLSDHHHQICNVCHKGLMKGSCSSAASKGMKEYEFFPAERNSSEDDDDDDDVVMMRASGASESSSPVAVVAAAAMASSGEASFDASNSSTTTTTTIDLSLRLSY